MRSYFVRKRFLQAVRHVCIDRVPMRPPQGKCFVCSACGGVITGQSTSMHPLVIHIRLATIASDIGWRLDPSMQLCPDCSFHHDAAQDIIDSNQLLSQDMN